MYLNTRLEVGNDHPEVLGGSYRPCRGLLGAPIALRNDKSVHPAVCKLVLLGHLTLHQVPLVPASLAPFL